MDASSIPYKFKTPWGASATAPQYLTAPIPAASVGAAAGQDLGFPPATATDPAAGGTPPNINDVNGALNYATLWTQWLQAGGPIGYDATFSGNIGGYPKGTLLQAASGTGQYWISTADNNTTDPDTGGAGWVSLASLGFPAGLGSITTTTTLTNANAGTFYNVGGSGVICGIEAETFKAGQTIGFLAINACTVATSRGFFYGGSLSETSSFAMPAGSFVALQWDGINWRQLAGSFLSPPPMHGGNTASNGGGNVSTSVTFTAPCKGIIMVNGSVATGGGAISSISTTYTGATGDAFVGANFINAGSTGFGSIVSSAVVSGVPGTSVTITAAAVIAGGSASNILFNYVFLPTP